MNLIKSPFHGRGEVLIDVVQILDNADLVAVAAAREMSSASNSQRENAYVNRAVTSLLSIVP